GGGGAARRTAKGNKFGQVSGDFEVEKTPPEPSLVSPRRRHDCSPISDGASAMVIAAGDVAKRVCKKPAWITGFAHIAEPQELGVRDLTRSRSTEIAAERAGVGKGRIDVAEIY